MLKNRTKPGLAIDTQLYNELKKLSEETKIPMSKLLDAAIELILNKYKVGK